MSVGLTGVFSGDFAELSASIAANVDRIVGVEGTIKTIKLLSRLTLSVWSSQQASPNVFEFGSLHTKSNIPSSIKCWPHCGLHAGACRNASACIDLGRLRMVFRTRVRSGRSLGSKRMRSVTR